MEAACPPSLEEEAFDRRSGGGRFRARENTDQGVGARVRGDVYQVISELKHVQETKGVSAADKHQAQQIGKQLGPFVEYAPFWVRMLSAISVFSCSIDSRICLVDEASMRFSRSATTLKPE